MVMIRFIVAMDNKNGIANEHGIPWQGQIPSDIAYFRSKTIKSNVLMGAGWYAEQLLPLPNRRNIVATSSTKPPREGFEVIHDARLFLQESKEDIWVGGGAALFASTLDLANELYITRLDADFKCTKFFPTFENDFKLIRRSDPFIESGITYHFEVWERLSE